MGGGGKKSRFYINLTLDVICIIKNRWCVANNLYLIRCTLLIGLKHAGEGPFVIEIKYMYIDTSLWVDSHFKLKHCTFL